jgi:RNA polymerase sigma factor (sigma-70 family)
MINSIFINKQKNMTATTTNVTFEEYWTKYKSMAYKLALSFNLQTNNEREDLIQCARVGLHLAMNTYVQGAGSTEASWVWTYMRREMVNYLNDNLRTIRTPVNKLRDKEREPQPTDYVYSLDDVYEDSGEPLYSKIAYDDTQYNEEDTSGLKKAIMQLKPQWQTIMSMLGEGHTMVEIGQHLGISKEAVRQQKEKALAKLREIMIK